MSTHVQTCIPVTALSVCGPLLVAGRGNYLHLYDGSNNLLRSSVKLFDTEIITSIIVQKKAKDSQQSETFLLVLANTSAKLVKLHDAYEPQNIDIVFGNKCLIGDWALDGCFVNLDLEDNQGRRSVATVVTAHNTLTGIYTDVSSLEIYPQEIASVSRCILYSAHVLQLNSHTILVAAGTAFGEIFVWSATFDDKERIKSTLHKVFTGHEGSVFGVRISNSLNDREPSKFKRLLASCSDDRTIRLWDISRLDDLGSVSDSQSVVGFLESRDTGFGANAEEAGTGEDKCVALAWGHLSRIWSVRFFDIPSAGDAVWSHLVSVGEDATYHVWKIETVNAEGVDESLKLQYVRKAAFHSGKNIWSSVLDRTKKEAPLIFTGGADGAIIRSLLSLDLMEREWTLPGVLQLAYPDRKPGQNTKDLKSKSPRDVFRTYAFADSNSFVATTNTGIILSATIPSSNPSTAAIREPTYLRASTIWQSVAHLDELKGYSVSASIQEVGIVFIAGSNGSVYILNSATNTISKVANAAGKVASLFPELQRYDTKPGKTYLRLIITQVGSHSIDNALFSFETGSQTKKLEQTSSFTHMIGQGTVVTSAVSIGTDPFSNRLALGTRDGRILIYSSPGDGLNDFVDEIKGVHGREAVTSMKYVKVSSGFLIYSVGRDGGCTVSKVDSECSHPSIVHKAPLPFGPNIEGLCITEDYLLCYGFRSKSFVSYDLSNEQELMSIECGGVHRNWSFCPSGGAGTFVCTKAGSVFVACGTRRSNTLILKGSHGREVKAVAASPSTGLVATGAEDTDIKIWRFNHDRLDCLRTIRRHTTGIQGLLWAKDGQYLFSSGGCEEFYVWRVCDLPLIGVGVVCEGKCPTFSETVDLRILGFDVKESVGVSQRKSFVISLVYSDSTLRVFHCVPDALSASWSCIYSGVYMTSCLTQCAYLNKSPQNILTAGTDGHIAYWNIPEGGVRSDQSIQIWERYKVHQSTIKILRHLPVTKYTSIVVTGGDDNGIGITLLRKQESSSESFTMKAYTLVIPRAHAATITAVEAIEMSQNKISDSETESGLHRLFTFRIISSGADQRLKIWDVEVDSELIYTSGISVTKVENTHTPVADVSSLAIIGTENEQGECSVIVCGVGFDVRKVKLH